MHLILIRHGLPVRSRETSNPPLAEKGHEQARKTAERLAREPIDAIYASTMVRAIQTAEPLAMTLAKPLVTHDGLVEFDRNAGSYVPMEELKRDNYEAWTRFVARGRDPQAITAFQAGVVAAMEEIIANHRGQRVAVFCHGGVINVWTAHILEMAPRLFFEPYYASIHRYLCASSGERNLVSLNDTAHLSAN
jgi:probable phosphoglycerate mutase